MSAFPGVTGRRRITLMRHGHVDYLAPEVVRSRNTRDVVLSPQGREEASAAGRALAHVAFDRAICSGFPRTRETAEIVLSLNQSPPELEAEPELGEIHGGQMSVKNRQELVATMAFSFARAAEPGATMLAGGEAFADAQARAVAAIRRLLGEPNWKHAFVAAHSGINSLLLSWAAGAGLAAVGTFEQDTGCINVLDFDMVPREDGGPGTEIERVLIKAVNLTPYNYVKHGMNMTSLEALFAR